MKYSAWAIVQYKDTYLLLKRGKKMNNPGLWNLPGGGVEKKERGKVKDAVIRELWEEAGIKVKPKQITFMKRVINGDRTMFYYHVAFDKKPNVKIDFESQAFKWTKLDDFPSKLHYQTKKFLKHSDKILGGAEKSSVSRRAKLFHVRTLVKSMLTNVR